MHGTVMAGRWLGRFRLVERRAFAAPCGTPRATWFEGCDTSADGWVEAGGRPEIQSWQRRHRPGGMASLQEAGPSLGGWRETVLAFSSQDRSMLTLASGGHSSDVNPRLTRIKPWGSDYRPRGF
jgi:hypothetical protein